MAGSMGKWYRRDLHCARRTCAGIFHFQTKTRQMISMNNRVMVGIILMVLAVSLMGFAFLGNLEPTSEASSSTTTASTITPDIYGNPYTMSCAQLELTQSYLQNQTAYTEQTGAGYSVSAANAGLLNEFTSVLNLRLTNNWQTGTGWQVYSWSCRYP